MGATLTYYNACTGRRDGALLEQSIVASYVVAAPTEQRLDDSDVEDGAGMATSVPWPSLAVDSNEIADLLVAYSGEVRDGHSFLTAADSYYHTLLEFQRRHDSVGIQAEAVSQLINAPKTAYLWRAHLVKKKAEAMKALASRAKHYAVGKRSARGLLQISSGALAESTLKSYQALLDREYDLAANEIEATLSALDGEPLSSRTDRANHVLEQLKRSESFWISQIEETFDAWQTASRNLDQAQQNRNGAWGELMPAVRALLAELRMLRRQGLPASASAVALRKQCCTRLLELDIHQYAHGLTSLPRRQLLEDVLASVRRDRAFQAVGQDLLHDANFRALQDVRMGDCGHGVLDIRSIPEHPWAAVLSEIFGELICALPEVNEITGGAEPEEPENLAGMASESVTQLQDIEYFLVRQIALDEIRHAAAVYVQPVSCVTPLHMAVRTHSSWVGKRLIELQANPLLCDANGVSPLSLSQKDGQLSPSLRSALIVAAKKWDEEQMKSKLMLWFGTSWRSI